MGMKAARKARPTGETFKPAIAHEQAKTLYPIVMALLR
jgi:hypothetical protein